MTSRASRGGRRTWTPPLRDDSGYCATLSDFEFLGLEHEDVTAFQQRDRPLGMSPDDWDLFRKTLFEALEEDGILDADVRLKGSSASFYAGPHKRMPSSERDMVAEFRTSYGRSPKRWERDHVKETWRLVWPPGEPTPLRRPFNALYKLRLHQFPSDYDLQISSNEVFRLGAAWIEREGLSGLLDLRNPSYAFMLKEVFGNVCEATDAWRIMASQFLRFDITIAAFPASGPPCLDADPDPTTRALSSHLKASDWIIRPEGDCLQTTHRDD